MPEPASHLLSSRPWGAPGSTESCHTEARYGMKSLWAKYHQISLHITIQYGLVYLKNQYPSLSAHLKNTHIISYHIHFISMCMRLYAYFRVGTKSTLHISFIIICFANL